MKKRSFDHTLPELVISSASPEYAYLEKDNRDGFSNEGLNLFNGTVHNNLKIGDYIYFGRYKDEPILWRVIHFDDDGNPLLFSDKILTHKAFNVELDGSIQSNLWEYSTIRRWLNSDSVQPFYSIVDNYKNEILCVSDVYDGEPGFLHGFSDKEKAAILPWEAKSLLPVSFKKERDGGIETYECLEGWNTSPDNCWCYVYNNYDSAFYKDIEDHVKLLSIDELYNYVYGEGMCISKLKTEHATKEASPNQYANNSGNSYMLRTMYPEYKDYVLVVKSPFHIGSTTTPMGVAPALYVNLRRLEIDFGNGSASNPYCSKEHAEILAKDYIKRSETVANILKNVSLLKGNGQDLKLHTHVKKLEAIVMAIRLLGIKSRHLKNGPCPFTDVPAWGIRYVNYAYSNKITTGISPNKFGSDKPVDYAMYYNLLLGVLGYKRFDENVDDAIALANKVGLLDPVIAYKISTSKTFTRRDLAYITYLCLNAKAKDRDKTLAYTLIDKGMINHVDAQKVNILNGVKEYALFGDLFYKGNISVQDEGVYITVDLSVLDDAISLYNILCVGTLITISIYEGNNPRIKGDKNSGYIELHNFQLKDNVITVFIPEEAFGCDGVYRCVINPEYATHKGEYNVLEAVFTITRVNGELAVEVNNNYWYNKACHDSCYRDIEMYTKPTKGIISTDREVKAIVSKIINNDMTSREKAIEIYRYVIENYRYEPSAYFVTFEPDVKGLIKSKLATSPMDIAYLIASLYRAADIPCRVGTWMEEFREDRMILTSNHYYWNEIYIDHRWHFINGAEGLRSISSSEFFASDELPFSYFDMSLEEISKYIKMDDYE